MHLTSAKGMWAIRIIWTIIALGIVIALGRALPLSAVGPTSSFHNELRAAEIRIHQDEFVAGQPDNLPSDTTR